MDDSLYTRYLHLTLLTKALFEMCPPNDVEDLLFEIYGVLYLLLQNISYLKPLPHLLP